MSRYGLKEGRFREIEEVRRRKFYSNVTINFPNGPAEIQFRDETDRTNLANVATAALALSAISPDTPMVYRTADNVVQTVPANQMAQIALQVMSMKQAVQSAYWAHKDALTLITDREAIKAYDITVGWPE